MRRLAGPAALAAVGLGLLVLPAARPPAFYESFLYLVFHWVALATSWSILSGYSGYFSFGHGAFFGAGMYATATLATAGLPFLATLPLAGLVAALFGMGMGAVVFRVRRLRGELFALLTLAVTFVLATIVLNTRIDGGPGVYLSAVPLPRILGSPTATLYLLGLAIAVVAVASAYAVHRARWGAGLFAIHDDEDVAEVLGVPTYRYKLRALGLSAGLAGVAGGIHAMFVTYVTVAETFSIVVPLYVVLMSVVGGARHWIGPAIGASLVTVLMYGGDRGPDGRRRAGDGRAHADARDPLPPGRDHRLREAAAIRATPVDRTPSGGRRAGLCRSASPADRPAAARVRRRPEVVSRRPGARRREPRGPGRRDPRARGPERLRQVDPHQRRQRPLPGGRRADRGRRRGRHRPPGPRDRAAGGVAHLPDPAALRPPDGPGQRGGRRHVRPLGRDRRAAEREAGRWLEFTGLADRADVLPAALNLHQRKFLELARALASEPRLVMLDEVLSGLTPSEMADATRLVRDIRERGTTVVFVEHIMRAVMALTDRVVVLDAGQVIASGAPQDVMRHPDVVQRYLGKVHA